MDDTVTCLVRGPASTYPRGFIWLIPTWFLLLSGAAVLLGTNASSTGQMPFWLGATELGSLLIAACIAVGALLGVRRRSFRADSDGIWLGVRTTHKRPKLRQVRLPWPDIAQLRLLPRHYGVLVEITLDPTARITRRPIFSEQVLLWFGALALPFWFGRGMPALTMPTGHPPRYQVKICDRTAAELRLDMAPLMPDSMSIRVATKKSATRVTVPSPAKPYSQPPTPVA